jgi:4-phytase / acid phosphatase
MAFLDNVGAGFSRRGRPCGRLSRSQTPFGAPAKAGAYKAACLIVIAAACTFGAVPVQQAKPAAELKYAIIVTRHGVRSPTWTRDRLDQYSAAPWPDWAVPGNLTAHGRRLMKIMGGFYRDYFGAKGLLVEAGCTRSYFRADSDQRTLETARALAEGIHPGCEVPIHSVTDGTVDPLFDPIEAGVAKPDPQLGLAAVSVRMGPQLAAVVDAHRSAFDELDRVLNGKGKAAISIFQEPMALSANPTEVTMSGPLRLASTFTENLLLEYTNGMRGLEFGWGRLDVSNLQRLMTLHTTYADLMRRTPYLARARGSNLLNHILRSLEQAANGQPVKGAAATPETQLVVISGHDTNLSNLSGMLGISWLLPSYQQDDVPPGAALIFSLWRSPDIGALSMRVQFVAQTLDQMHEATPLSLSNPPSIADVFVPGCSTAREGFSCEWRDFQRAVQAAIDPAFVR